MSRLLFAAVFSALPCIANAQSLSVCAAQYTGVTYSGPAGAPVRVADDGEVVFISHASKVGRFASCGTYVVVVHRHASGRSAYTRYGEMDSLVGSNGEPIKVGTQLKKGESVGKLSRAGVLYFEVRPFGEGKPRWSAVDAVDPQKFSFATYTSKEAPLPRQSNWTRYQKTDADAFLTEAWVIPSGGDVGKGLKVYPQPTALRMSVVLHAPPSPCSPEKLHRALGRVGVPTNTMPHLNMCAAFRSPQGRVFRAFVQDVVTDTMVREVAIGEELEIFVLHVLTDQFAVEEERAGLAMNEFNVLP